MDQQRQHQNTLTSSSNTNMIDAQRSAPISAEESKDINIWKAIGDINNVLEKISHRLDATQLMPNFNNLGIHSQYDAAPHVNTTSQHAPYPFNNKPSNKPPPIYIHPH